ncbi:MAG: 3-isopropylmalate dehydratase large subunit [Kofleriaceae bacterium]
MGRSLVEKLWDAHAVATTAGQTLLYIDRHLIHEGSKPAFEALAKSGRGVRRPQQTFAFADHYAPTVKGRGFTTPESQTVSEALARNAGLHALSHFGVGHPRHGIVHVVAPELGIVLPGMTVACGDSHTSTCGALGVLAFGIGASEIEHVLAMQTLWLPPPQVLRVDIDGELGAGVTAKDLVVHVIARIGAAGALGHVVEFAGSTITALGMEQRMTICNMAVEAGGRTGIIAPDDTTLAYVKGRPFAPRDADWDRLVELVRSLAPDPDATYARRVAIAAADVVPMVTWGTNPEQAAPVTEHVPDPQTIGDAKQRAMVERALAYMALEPGQLLASVAIDRVFIGSCTNARIEDLRAAAAVLRGHKARIPGIVVPGSAAVKREAEAEGLDRVFTDAGLEWREPGCSMCLAINGDLAAPGERCASTSNRNFEGRQGKGARTHLMSPAMAAAAAITGHLTDVRTLARQR